MLIGLHQRRLGGAPRGNYTVVLAWSRTGLCIINQAFIMRGPEIDFNYHFFCNRSTMKPTLSRSVSVESFADSTMSMFRTPASRK